MKILNALVRWMKRNPRSVTFNKMDDATKCVAVSDSAFNKVDEESCHALRGCVIGLMDGTADKVESGKIHIMEVECRKQKVVTRATFSAECHAAIADADTEEGFRDKTVEEVTAEKLELKALLLALLIGGTDLSHQQTQALLRLERE